MLFYHYTKRKYGVYLINYIKNYEGIEPYYKFCRFTTEPPVLIIQWIYIDYIYLRYANLRDYTYL